MCDNFLIFYHICAGMPPFRCQFLNSSDSEDFVRVISYEGCRLCVDTNVRYVSASLLLGRPIIRLWAFAHGQMLLQILRRNKPTISDK